MLDMAHATGDADLLIGGHTLASTCYCWAGDFTEALAHADKVLDLYDDERYRHFAEAQPLLNYLFYEKREAALTGKQGWLVLERDGYIDGEYELRRAHVGLRRNWTTPRDSAPVPKV
jgi:hypothetical protein